MMDSSKVWLILISILAIVIIWSVSLSYADADLVTIETICKITDIEPFYNCNEKWLIIVSDKIPKSMCESIDDEDSAYACIWYSHKVIFMPVISQDDMCGRTTIHHEILHMAFPWKPVHEECRNWY